MSTDSPKKPEMVGSAFIAAFLGITDDAARDRIRAGDFQGAVKLGKSWYVPRRVLEAMAAGVRP